MKTSTLLILGGLGAAALYALSKQQGAEGGDTFEPDVGPPPDLPDLPEANFEPSPGTQPATPPMRVDQLLTE